MKKNYNIKVKLLSPMHINGGTSPDGRRITITQDKKPFIPATLFKGMVRNNFEMFYNTYHSDVVCNDQENANKICKCPSCVMFGRSGFQKSRVIFDNLELQEGQESVIELRANNSINRMLRKTKECALVFTETVSPLDKNRQPLIFTGNMLVYYPKDNAELLENYLKLSIEHIVSIGLGKSRGFGFVNVEVEEIVEKS